MADIKVINEGTSKPGGEEKRVFMSISFHSIPVSQAEALKKTILDFAPAGSSFAVYFDDAIVVDQI